MNDGFPAVTQTELSIVQGQVLTALRQIDQADAAFRLDFNFALTQQQGSLSPEADAAFLGFSDAMDYCLVTLCRACRVPRYLATRGIQVPAIAQADLIRSLRDLAEHWDEWSPVRDPASIDEKPWLKTRSAGKRLEKHAPKNWIEGLSSGTVENGLRSWQGINVPRVREELVQINLKIRALLAVAPVHPSFQNPAAD